MKKKENEMLQAQFDRLCERGNLFRSSVTGEQLWTAYMDGCGRDPVFLSPTNSVHNCRTCRRFIERYPQFASPEQMAELERNTPFRQFCGSRFGMEPLAALYADYLALVDEIGMAALARERSRALRGTGSGVAGGATLSPAQKAALDAWNAEHPEMAMTAGEYLGR